MLYQFTNRRRAKDAITTLVERYGYNGITVFVREDSVYIDLDGVANVPDIATIMHFAVDGGNVDDMLNLDDITELYKHIGITHFRM